MPPKADTPPVEPETKPEIVEPVAVKAIEPPTEKSVETAVVEVNEPPYEKSLDNNDPTDEPPVAEKPLVEKEPTADKIADTPKEVTASALPESSPREDDDKHAYSLERSGRKAAKEAAEKLKGPGKKNKKREKSDKITAKAAEEDPWVQCDRCHKWRHLPATVNLDSLPEHWFCELNTFDEKRNHCDAPEQTPKDVAKEKKRLKKLALKKLQMEQAEEQGEWDGKSSPKDESEAVLKRKRSTSPDPNEKNEEEYVTGGESPKAVVKPKGKRGRPRNEDRAKAKEEKGGKDDKK
jgi:hypothetical protein